VEPRAKKRATAQQVRAVLAEQPLVGASAAAKILGIPPPNIARLRKQQRLPAPIPVEGTADAYLRSEIEALAKVLRAKRRAAGGRRVPERVR